MLFVNGIIHCFWLCTKQGSFFSSFLDHFADRSIRVYQSQISHLFGFGLQGQHNRACTILGPASLHPLCELDGSKHPACPGYASGSPPGWTCPEHLPRETSRRRCWCYWPDTQLFLARTSADFVPAPPKGSFLYPLPYSLVVCLNLLATTEWSVSIYHALILASLMS